MNILTIGADNLITLNKLMQPNTNPPIYINSGTLTWQLWNVGLNTEVPSGSGNYNYISGSNGTWQTTIPASLTSSLTKNVEYILNTNVVATGFTSLFSDNYVAQNPTSSQFAYCLRSDIENIYGTVNVAKWADINNDGNPQTIDARINWAITSTYDYINNQLIGGVYVTPLTGQYPMIVNCAAYLSAIYLYESRVLANYTGDGEPQHQLTQGKKWANNILLKLRAGTLRIYGVLPQDVLGINYPIPLRMTQCRPFYGWGYGFGCNGLF